MKRILGAVALTAATTTAHAQQFEVFELPLMMHCSYDFGVFADVYGNDLSPMIEPMVNEYGYGLVVIESNTHKAVLALMPDGAWCVVWDSIRADSPA